MSEQAEFLKDLDVENKDDVFDKPLTEAEPEKEEPEEEDDKVAPNRYWRRMKQKVDQYKDETIALNERIKVLSEVNKFREDVGDDPLKEVEAIFGTDTPEKLSATTILKKALSGMSESAVNKALEKIQEQREKESQAVRDEENAIEKGLERLEDEENADFSNPTERKAFLNLLEKLSPKDSDGNIKEYADFGATYEIFEKSKEKSTRAKELASRSMTHSGASKESKLEDDALSRFIRENM